MDFVKCASGGFITSSGPYGFVYTALGGDGNYHVYFVQTHDTTSVPIPVQISSLSVTPGANKFDANCFDAFFTQGFDPTTQVILIEVPTTAPNALPASIKTTHIHGLYKNSGALTGLVTNDTSGSLNYYINFPTFTLSSTITSGVTTRNGHFDIGTDRAGKLLTNGSVVFVDVLVGGVEKIYRVDTVPSSMLIYSASGSINGGLGLHSETAYDNTNVYFYDRIAGSPNKTFKFLKTPIASAAVATTLYTDSASPSAQTYSIVDSDGKFLIIGKDLSGVTPLHAIETLSLTATPPVIPATLVTTSAPTIAGFSSFLAYAADHLFVNTASIVNPSSSAVYTPSSSTAIVGPGGAGTSFGRLTTAGVRGIATSAPAIVFELTGITSATHEGGASLYIVDAGSFAKTQVTQGGSNYVVPASTNLIVAPFSSSPTTIGSTVAAGAAIDGLALDESTSKLITITQPGDDVIGL